MKLNKCKLCGCETKNPNYCSRKCSAGDVNARRIYDSKSDNNKTKILNCPRCTQPFETYWRAGKYTLCKSCKRLPVNEKDLWGKKQGVCKYCQTPVTVKLLAPLLCKNALCIEAYSKHHFKGLENRKAGGESLSKIIATKMQIQQTMAWNEVSRSEKLRRIRTRGKCEICNCSEWMGKPLSFHIHHKTGPKIENKESDLQLLCPNCHSQTSDYGFRGKKHSIQTSELISTTNKGRRFDNKFAQIKIGESILV